MPGTVIECALNGPWTRRLQPLIPVTVAACVAEGIACAEAGAALLHVHPYDEDSGCQRDDWEIYARIIEGIRSRIDIPVYPTIPLGNEDTRTDPAARYRATAELAARGLIEFAAVDPGSVSFVRADGAPGFVYANAEADVLHALSLAAAHDFVPCYAIYEPGFLRSGAALHARVPGAPRPLYRFMFSSEFLFGFPPVDYGLECLLRLLADTSPGAAWMTSGLGVDISPLVELTVARGGHLRVGLEDAPLGTARGNVAWVEHAVQAVLTAGGAIASVAEARTLLRPGPPRQ